jgi:hypothetical protein
MNNATKFEVGSRVSALDEGGSSELFGKVIECRYYGGVCTRLLVKWDFGTLTYINAKECKVVSQ